MGSNNKLTARISPKDYQPVKEYFQHGQQTQFFRLVYASLRELIETGKQEEIMQYLYQQKPLVLPAQDINKTEPK